MGRSWEAPGDTLRVNGEMTLNLLEAVLAETPEARVLVASSGEVYGTPATPPVREDAPLRPQNPYAVSKAQSDLLAGFYADARGLHVVRARAFNHAGPGQGDHFALSSFARQAAAGASEIRCGALHTRRDFTDVRDVVRAYLALLQHGESGGVYNVCSGRSTSTAELVALVAGAAGRELTPVPDPARVRPHEVADLYGDPSRLLATTGWAPAIGLEQTAADTLAWWANVDSRAPAPE